MGKHTFIQVILNSQVARSQQCQHVLCLSNINVSNSVSPVKPRPVYVYIYIYIYIHAYMYLFIYTHVHMNYDVSQGAHIER